MKKVVLFLVLASLVVCLAQAQVPQARLVWSKPFPGQPGIQTAIDTFQGKLQALAGVNGQFVLIDTTGAMTPLFAVPPNYGATLLNGGRFITLWPGWQNPGPTYLYDCTGRQLAAVTLGGKLSVNSVSDDGKYFAAKMFSWDPYVSYPNGEIRLFEGSGQLTTKIKVENHWGSRFSPDGSRFIVQQAKDPSMVVYDQNGRKLWQVMDVVCYPPLAFLPDNRVFVYCVSRDNKSYGRFYDRDGRLLREYPLPHIQSVDDKLFHIAGTTKAILNSNRKFTCYFKMDTGEILWQRETAGYVVAVSPDGNLVVLRGGLKGRRPGISTTVLDGNGNAVFEGEGTTFLQLWSNKAGSKGWYVLQEGDLLKLYTFVK